MPAKKNPPVDEATRTKIVDLRRGGMSMQVIARRTELPLATVVDVLEAYLSEIRTATDPRLEIDRLDRMLAGIWASAASGDGQAVDRALKISERRDRLERQIRSSTKGEMRAAFDESVDALTTITGCDKSVVAAGRAIADRVDYAIAGGDGHEITKAMYLVPHLLNVLRELEASPKARAEKAESAPEATAGPVPGGKKITALRERYLATAPAAG